MSNFFIMMAILKLEFGSWYLSCLFAAVNLANAKFTAANKQNEYELNTYGLKFAHKCNL